MATIKCTRAEFNAAFCEFNKVAGSTRSTQEQVALAHKCLVLHYLGIEDATDSEIASCATTLEVATLGAIRRGWDLQVPDLTGGADVTG